MTPSARFAEALAYAIALHAQQRRKGTSVPYVAHLLAVTALVLEHGGNEDEAIAAALHDAIEDQGGGPDGGRDRTAFRRGSACHRRGMHRRRRHAQALLAGA